MFLEFPESKETELYTSFLRKMNHFLTEIARSYAFLYKNPKFLAKSYLFDSLGFKSVRSFPSHTETS